MAVRTPEAAPLPRSRPVGPGAVTTLLVVALAWVLLMANGRSIGMPEASGVAGGVLRAALVAAGLGLDLDETTRALVGKGLAALFAALASGALFAAVARRHALDEASAAGLLLATGTTLAAAAQAWSGEAPSTCAVAVALWLFARAEAEEEPGLAAGALVPLGLAVALLPSTLVLAAVLAVATVLRFRPPLLPVAVGAALGLLMALGGLWLRGSPGTVPPPTGGPVASLLSPAQGALVFVPLALVGVAGIARSLRPPRPRYHWDQARPSRGLPAACAVAALGHLIGVGLGSGWATGPAWGPRLLAPAWPALLLFLPEGFALLRGLGVVLAALSVAIQAIGAFAYDGRWDRLNRGPGGTLDPVVWEVARSPIAFQIDERVVRPALPTLEGRRFVARDHPLVVGGSAGSFVSFARDRPDVTGADATLGDVLLEGGAQTDGGRLRLRAPGDALFFRVRESARIRQLELRVAGRGQGTLGVGEKTFWTATRWHERPVAGPFRLRLPYFYPESGGPDVRLAWRGGGAIEIESLALVPPAEPENVIRR